MQFTLGDHVDQTGRLSQTSGVYTHFRNLRDEQLGTVDYRRSARILEQDKENWIKRSDQEIDGGKWPTRTVTKAEFEGEWPFRADRVVIECRNDTFCIVNIDGYTFALNGAAKSRFKIPFPHDAKCRSTWEIGRPIHRDGVRTSLSCWSDEELVQQLGRVDRWLVP